MAQFPDNVLSTAHGLSKSRMAAYNCIIHDITICCPPCQVLSSTSLRCLVHCTSSSTSSFSPPSPPPLSVLSSSSLAKYTRFNFSILRCLAIFLSAVLSLFFWREPFCPYWRMWCLGRRRESYIADRSTCLHVPLTVLACAEGLCCVLCQWLAGTEETL